MSFHVDRIALAPGQRLAYDSADWEDSLVRVAAGELAVVGLGGRRECFARGAVLVLGGLSLRALACGGGSDVVIVRIARQNDE